MAPPGYAVRVGEWKGVVHACADQQAKAPSMSDSMELYDLSADPHETTDISAAHPMVVKSIKALLTKQGLSCACWQC